MNIIRSEISKNKDILGSLEEHKKFIMELSKIQNLSWVRRQEEARVKKKERIKRRWIEEHKRDTRDDHIIFDEIYNIEAYLQRLENKTATDLSEKGAAVAGGA